MLARLEDSLLVVVDLQPAFMAPIVEIDSVLARANYLLRVGQLLGVPRFATEQYPSRMGHTHELLMPGLDRCPIEGKMVFSCLGAPSLRPWIDNSGRRQVVLVGIETPICVNQTAHELLELGYEVIVAEDAVGGRSELMHRNGIERMRAAGATIAHTDSIVYEWMRTAEHPQFRDVLKIVKEL